MNNSVYLFKSLLALSEPHEVLCERVELIFNEIFQLDEQPDLGRSEVSHTIEDNYDEMKPINTSTVNQPKNRHLPPLEKSRNNETFGA